MIKIHCFLRCALFLGLALLSLSCSNFHRKFDKVQVTCGRSPDGANAPSMLAFQARDALGPASSEGLEAYWIQTDGTRHALTFSARGCIYLAEHTEGFLAFVDRSSARLGLISLASSGPGHVESVPLQDFPALKAELSCSGQDLWTNQGFATFNWNISQAGERLSRFELHRLWPILDLTIAPLIPLERSEPAFRLDQATARNLISSTEAPNVFTLVMPLPSERTTAVGLALTDILGRQHLVEGGAACKFHMTRARPEFVSFVPEAEFLRIERGQSVSIAASANDTLYIQVTPLPMDQVPKKWAALSDEDQEEARQTFRVGRSPVFWQEGAYLLRAFTQNQAGNRSEVWERLIQVAGSPLIEKQITQQHRVLDHASPTGGAALLDLSVQAGQATLRLRDLQRPDADEELWHPPVQPDGLPLFESGFNINRQIIEGRFGFLGSSARQFCIIRGRQVADAYRSDFPGRMFCWERDETGAFKVVLDAVTPIWDIEVLDVAQLDRTPQEEIAAFSSLDGHFRFFRQQDNRLHLMTETEINGIDELSWNRAQIGAQFAFFKADDESHYMLKVNPTSDFAEVLSSGVTGPAPTLYLYVYQYVNPQAFDCGIRARDPQSISPIHKCYMDRVQIVNGWNRVPAPLSFDSSLLPLQQPLLLSQNRQTGLRWIRSLQTSRFQRSSLYQARSLQQPGLPHASQELCYFFQGEQTYSGDEAPLQCLAFSADPHSRNKAQVFRYDEQSALWAMSTTFNLQNQRKSQALPLESPQSIRGIVAVPYLQPYTLASNDAEPLHWSFMKLKGSEAAQPELTQLDPEQKARLMTGQGPLELFGNDERLAVWFRTGSSETWTFRELRFAGAVTVSSDLGQGVGLVDLSINGTFSLIQPQTHGFASLLLAPEQDWVRSEDVPLPDFLNDRGWNGRSISLISGRLLLKERQSGAVFCYLARASRRDASFSGQIACYAWDPVSNKMIKAHEGPFPIDELEEIAAIRVADETVLMKYNPRKVTLEAYRFKLNANGVLEPEVLQWNTPAKTYWEITVARGSHGSGFDPTTLHFTSQLQSNTPDDSPFAKQGGRFVLSDSNMGSSWVADLIRDPASGLLAPPKLQYFGRWGLFSKQRLDGQERIDDQAVLGSIHTRGFLGNVRPSSQNCHSYLSAAVLDRCSLYSIQIPDYLLGYFYWAEQNESAVKQPAALLTHWHYQFWGMHEGSSVIYSLSVPKKFSPQGWQLLRSSIGEFPSPNDTWLPVRDINLLP